MSDMAGAMGILRVLLPLAETEAETRRLIARATLTEATCTAADEATAAVTAARLLLESTAPLEEAP